MGAFFWTNLRRARPVKIKTRKITGEKTRDLSRKPASILGFLTAIHLTIEQ